jgi:hypothetical protein
MVSAKTKIVLWRVLAESGPHVSKCWQILLFLLILRLLQCNSSFFTAFDTRLNVYQAISEEDCTATCVGGNDDHDSELEICTGNDLVLSAVIAEKLSPGTYYVAVSGFGDNSLGYQEGQFELKIITEREPTVAPTLAPSIVAPPPTPTVVDSEPSNPPEDGPVAETNLSIDFQPVSEPFEGSPGIDIVETATSAFFSELLFGETPANDFARDGDSARFIEIELLDSEVTDLGGLVARRKLRVDLNVKATNYETDDFKGILVGLIAENPELYASRLRLTESTLSEELDIENAEYFSLVETITVVGEDAPTTSAPTSAPNTAPPSGQPATVQIESGAQSVNWSITTTVIAGLAIVGILLEAC